MDIIKEKQILKVKCNVRKQLINPSENIFEITAKDLLTKDIFKYYVEVDYLGDNAIIVNIKGNDGCIRVRRAVNSYYIKLNNKFEQKLDFSNSTEEEQKQNRIKHDISDSEFLLYEISDKGDNCDYSDTGYNLLRNVGFLNY